MTKPKYQNTWRNFNLFYQHQVALVLMSLFKKQNLNLTVNSEANLKMTFQNNTAGQP